MRRILLKAVLVGAVLAPTRPLFSQDTPTAPYKLQLTARLATADVSVQDKRTKAPLENLTAADFRVFDNDREQPITHFNLVGKDDRPLAIVLQLNLWQGYYRIFGDYNKHIVENLPAAVHAAFANLRPDDRVAIVTFGIKQRACVPTVEVAQDFTADASKIGELLEKLMQIHEHASRVAPDDCDFRHATEGKQRVDEAYTEAFHGAIRVAEERLSSLTGYRREVIAFDDDYFLEEKKDANELADGLLQRDIAMNVIKSSMWAIEFNRHGIYAPMIAMKRSYPLTFYAGETGGTAVSPPSKKYGEALQQILFGLGSAYSIGWKPPEADGKFHRIRVELRGHTDARLQTRKGYVAPKDDAPAPQAQ